MNRNSLMSCADHQNPAFALAAQVGFGGDLIAVSKACALNAGWRGNAFPWVVVGLGLAAEVLLKTVPFAGFAFLVVVAVSLIAHSLFLSSAAQLARARKTAKGAGADAAVAAFLTSALSRYRFLAEARRSRQPTLSLAKYLSAVERFFASLRGLVHLALTARLLPVPVAGA